MKHKIYLAIIIPLFLTQQSYTMEKENGQSRRHKILQELSEVDKSNREFFSGTFTYKDNNFIREFLALAGQTTAVLDERNEDTVKTIHESMHIRTGHWLICEEDICMATGNVHECVAIAVRHAHPNLVALYHYYQKADEDFTKLDNFLSDVKNKAEQLHITLSDLATCLVSSFISSNFIIIKRALQDHYFAVPLCHVRPRGYLNSIEYVDSTDTVMLSGRLILVSPSSFNIHQYNCDDPGKYDSDLPDDDVWTMF